MGFDIIALTEKIQMCFPKKTKTHFTIARGNRPLDLTIFEILKSETKEFWEPWEEMVIAALQLS